MNEINGPLTLRSPDARLEVTLTRDAGGALLWSVRRDGQVLIAPSRLGLETRGGPLPGPGFVLARERRRANDTTYPLLSGKSSRARDNHNEMVLTLRSGSGDETLDLVFRAYDEGVAFRYVLPAGDRPVEIVAEQTEFRFAADHRCWALELGGFATPYESEFVPRRLSEIAPGALIGLPLTIEMEHGPVLVLTEAALTDFAGLYVGGRGTGETTLVSTLAPRTDDAPVCVRAPAGSPLSSPWRVLLVGDEPADLIASNLVLNLNEPCALADTAWIKPGKVTWDWWSGPAVPNAPFPVGMNDATMRHFIDFAADFALDYMLIDGGWYGKAGTGDADATRSVPAIDLPGLIAYARAKSVDTLVWLHQKDVRDGDKLDRAFAYYESVGVQGVKVDFFDRDDQDTVAFCRRVVEVAARHRLVVDLHGVFKPTGFSRTFPNLLTHEGVLGAEYNKWCARATPTHNVTLPFTRMLAGPMDYTPGAFNNVTTETFEARNKAPMAVGTRCHQLAMYVVFESGLQMVSDYPDAIRNQPGADFLRAVPAAWDETRPLAGRVAEYVALVRRTGNEWFVGAMTNETRRDLTLPLPFLPSDQRFHATVYADGPDAARTPTQVTTSTRTLTSDDMLALTLAPSGGAAVHLTPA